MEIDALICKCCGATLKAGSSTCECEYCGAINIVTGEVGKFINQLNRANKLRQNKEFDRALKIYDEILSENSPSSDVLWSRTLCEYGIEYVPDPSSNKYIPTLHRIKDESILNSPTYLEALELADDIQRKTIESEATAISKIQNEYLDIVSKEKPYDVFLCYKETDDITKLQTEDSGLALDLYDRLNGYGFKVFFARVTLQDKIGVNYEPYIFGALKSAKIMVVVGTKAEYFNSVWVKNEWSRFLKLMETDKDKQMFFACDDIEDLPRAFSGRQAQILNQPNAIQNLAFAVKRCLEQIKGNESTEVNAELSVETLLMQAIQFENDSEFAKAKAVYERVLKIDPNNVEALSGIKRVEISALFVKANVFINNDDWESAMQICKQILDIDPSNKKAKDLYRELNVCNIGGVIVNPERGKEIIEMLPDGKIGAIKALKDVAGIGLKEAKEAIESYMAENYNTNQNNSTQKGGCYVATCVYGSYDCPEVWILRRYRDNYLDQRWYGRVFIQIYYAISPTVVKLFGDYDSFKRFFKPRLDSMVERLSALGYEDTPYSDKY